MDPHFETVEPVFQDVFSRVWADGSEGPLTELTPVERAIYATRVVEGELDNGGWYQVFGNGVDHLIEPAIEGYELLGLPEYADHFRRVRAAEFTEETAEEIGEAFDEEYFSLSGSEAARAAALGSN